MIPLIVLLMILSMGIGKVYSAEIPADMTIQEFIDQGGLALAKDDKIKFVEYILEVEKERDSLKNKVAKLEERINVEREADDKHIESLENELKAKRNEIKEKDIQISNLKTQLALEQNKNVSLEVGDKIKTFGSGMATGAGIVLLLIILAN